MNTKHIKAYAPKARNRFIEAVTKRLNEYGIKANSQGHVIVSQPKITGSIFEIDGKQFDVKQLVGWKSLEKKASEIGYQNLIDQVANTWFNRFCAIRYMECHDYLEHGLRVLSHPEQHQSFQILDHAQDVATDLGLNKNHVIDLKLANKEEELYRDLLLAQCHQLHAAMPFLFEALDDATELLLPDNLTRTDSLIRDLVDDIPEEDWRNVEIIGWLYQFYISEKKDQVIGKVVKSEDIPAATQLFTPNWIVQYLVQNSIGRQWMLTHPQSTLKAKIPYYIPVAEQPEAALNKLKTLTPSELNPEDIKVIDPACGSGHILVEAYNTLYAIYEEQGYRSRDIPKQILEKNLYGLDLDDRAAQLAGFALMMKAREDDRKIFTRNITLNVLALQETAHLSVAAVWKGLNLNQQWQSGRTAPLFSEDQISIEESDEGYKLIQYVLEAFQQAKTFGSLIEIEHSKLPDLVDLQLKIKQLSQTGDTLQKPLANTLHPILAQAIILAQKFDAVIANPPYIGSKYHTPALKQYLKNNFSGYDKDLFSAFIIRNLKLSKPNGQLGFMTPFVWMFISSYEKLRNKIINDETISSLVQLEYSGFDGATVPICTFTLTKDHIPSFRGTYIRLSDFKGHENQGPKALEAIQKERVRLENV